MFSEQASTRKVKKIFKTPNRKRVLGKPRKSWVDDLKEDLKRMIMAVREKW